MTANPLPPIPPISATSGMAPAAGAGRFKPVDPIKVLREHMYLLIGAAVLGIALGVGTWVLLRQYAPQFTSYDTFVAQSPNTNAYQPSSDSNSANSSAITRTMRTQAAYIASPGILRQALESPLARNTKWFHQQSDPREALQTLQKDVLSVSPDRNSNIIKVSVTTGAKEDPQRLVTAIQNVYLRTLRQQAQQNSTNNNTAFVEARNQAQQDIENLNSRIKQFTIRNDLTSLQARTSDADNLYQKYTTQQGALILTLDQAKETLKGLKKKQSQGTDQVGAEVIEQIEQRPSVLQITYRINNLRQQLRAVIAQYGPNHPTAQQLRNQVDAARQQKKAEIDRLVRQHQIAQLKQAQQRVQSIQGQIDALQPRLKKAAARLTDLNTKLQTYHDLQDQLEAAKESKQKAQNSINEGQLLASRADAMPIKLQQSPTAAELTFPSLPLTVGGVLFLVLGISAGSVFLKELLDQRVKSPADVKLLPDVELLGVLPHASEDPSNPKTVERVVQQDPAGLMAESFRQTRTAILSKMDRRGYRTLMIVSGQPQCGATSVAQNLAVSMAHNGRKVLIVDVNFRRPSQCRLAGVENHVGLIDVLQERASIDDALVTLESPNLCVLPTGNAGDAPPEVLEHAGFHALLSELENRYDTILIDTAPVLLTSEAQLLAKQVDAIALVVRASSDKRGMVERMLRRLDGHRADVLGVILNGVRSSAGGYFRKNYRDFYRYRQNTAPAAASRNGQARSNGAAAANESATGGGRSNGAAHPEDRRMEMGHDDFERADDVSKKPGR